MCGLRTDGTVVCRGRSSAPPEGERFDEIFAGPLYVCGLGMSSVACWDTGSDSDFLKKKSKFVSMAIGYQHFCGLDSDGVAECSGGEYGQPPAHERFVSLTGLGDTACGLRDDGYVVCWDLISGRSRIASLPQGREVQGYQRGRH